VVTVRTVLIRMDRAAFRYIDDAQRGLTALNPDSDVSMLRSPSMREQRARRSILQQQTDTSSQRSVLSASASASAVDRALSPNARSGKRSSTLNTAGPLNLSATPLGTPRGRSRSSTRLVSGESKEVAGTPRGRSPQGR
jgi:hypothetical protein